MDLRRACRRLLIVVSVAFLLSAWLYCLATLRATSAENATIGPEPQLIGLFRDHGTTILLIELALLAATAIALVLAERKHVEIREPDSRRVLAEDQQQDESPSEHHDDRDDQDG